jgi:hypothetical protein
MRGFLGFGGCAAFARNDTSVWRWFFVDFSVAVFFMTLQ